MPAHPVPFAIAGLLLGGRVLVGGIVYSGWQLGWARFNIPRANAYSRTWVLAQDLAVLGAIWATLWSRRPVAPEP